MEDLDHLDPFPKMGSHTGFSVGRGVGLLVDGKNRIKDGWAETDGVGVGTSVGLSVGFWVGEMVG